MQTIFCPYCLKLVQTDTCPYCGNDVNYPGNPMHLPVGYTLNGQHPYVLGAALGQGGFGITYIAMDGVTGTRVAIKEYFPTHCSGRNNETSVQSYLGQEEIFNKGKEQFLLEARTLQSLSDLKGIVDVLDFFEANNSAYLVMEYLEGCSLKDYVEQNGRIPAQQFLTQLQPLMEDLAGMHRRGVIHRDIAPDNIMLLPDGRMKLIDFGAARSYVGDKSMTVVVKKGFAPVEQYMRKGSGPVTDVYALAATIYFCVTGQVPPDSAERQYGEVELQPAAVYGAELTQQQETGLMQALEIQPKARTQSIDELLAVIIPQNNPRIPEPEPPQPKVPKMDLPRLPQLKKKWYIPALAACLVLMMIFALPKEEKENVKAVGHMEETSPATIETANSSQPVRTNTSWRENILRLSNDLEYLSLAYNGFGKTHKFLDTDYNRIDITAVTFLDYLKDVPAQHWDVSRYHDGSVLAWAETGMTEDGSELVHMYIAGEGGINGRFACKYLFVGCENLTSITFNGALHTDEAESMRGMFEDCVNLKELDLSAFRTENVTDMSCMFFSCRALRNVDLYSFNTSRVVDMSAMFNGCQSLTELNCSHFVTTNVKDMSTMFLGYPLSEIDIRSFDTSSVTDMSGMFMFSDNLQTVDLRGIDTSNVEDMMQMFMYSENLTEIRGIEDLNTASVTSMVQMFYGCDSLPELELNWDVRLVKSYGDGKEPLYGYTEFMEEGKKVNGKPWKSFFR